MRVALVFVGLIAFLPAAAAQDTDTHCGVFIGAPSGFGCSVGDTTASFCQYDCHGIVVARCFYDDARTNPEPVHCALVPIS